MASLNSLLNPESSYESSLRLQQAARSPSSTTTSPTEKTSEGSTTAVELRPPPRAEVVIRAHEPHPDCPDTLACLPDTDGRPQHTLPVILRCTILGSPRKRLTIREIYAAMERKYPYYKTAGPAWKQSVRHHLSLNRLFERQPRPPSDPGFGSYWTVNLDAPPGTKRPRKRGGRSNKTDGSELGIIHGLGPLSPNTIIPMHLQPISFPTLSGPPASQPPPSATSSTASTMMSSSPNPASSSSVPTSVRPPPSSHTMSQSYPHDERSHHNPPPSLSQAHSQHMSQSSYYRNYSPPPQHPHPHVHAQSPHPQAPPQPPTHGHSQPPPHPHTHPHAHPHHPHPHSHSHLHLHPHSHQHQHQHQQQHPHSHPHAQSPHAHSVPPHSQPPPPPQHSHPQNSSHPHPHSQSHLPPPPPYSHAPSQQNSQPPPPPPPPSHPHAHSQPPPPNHSHLHPHQHPHQHPSPNANTQLQPVSTIAKLRPVDSRSFTQTSVMRNRGYYDDDDDDEMDWEDDADVPQYSDDDYSSSDEMPYKYDPRSHNRGPNSYSGSSHRSHSGSQGQSGKSLHGAFSTYSVDHADSTIERLKMEMAGLRRQSQDAVNASLRLSDQLNASQEEAARAKAALKVAENMLEEEARRRIQAEKNAEEEARRRRAAEDTLRQYQAQVQRKPASYSR